MILCVLSVPLPFYIALPGKVRFYLNFNGQVFWIEPELVKGATMFSMTENPLEWLGKTKDSGVNVLYYWVKSAEDEIGKQQEIYMSSETPDILGTVIFNNVSRARIYFEAKSLSEIKQESEIEKARLSAHAALAHFIDVYGLLSGDIEVHRFASSQAYASNLLWTEEYSVKDKQLFVHGVHAKYIATLDPIKTSAHKYLFKKVFTDVQKLSDVLNQSSRLEKHLEIIMESRTLLAQRNHDLSIVLAETAFEVFLRVTLLNLCERAHITKLPNRANTSTMFYKKAVEEGTVVRDLLRYLNLFAVDHVIGDHRYTNWKKHTHDKRVEIVHKAIFGNSQKEAELAVNSAVYFIQYISGLMCRRPKIDLKKGDKTNPDL